MICNATYDSFDAIPEALRPEFEQVNGKWQLKADAIPGVGPLFNAGLAANEQRAVGQAKAQRDKAKALQEELDRANDKLSILDSPGNRVLSKADADTFDAYTSLGTPSEIKTKLDKLPDLEARVSKFETSKALEDVAKANGLGDVRLNSEVLSDWLSSPESKGITAFVKTEERTDAKGVKVSIEVPYLRVETEENGATKVTEKELLTFAKEKLPDWKYAALVAAGPEPDKGQQRSPQDDTRHRVPNLGSSREEPKGDDKKRPVDKYNEARSSRPNPFAPKTVVAGGAMPPIR